MIREIESWISDFPITNQMFYHYVRGSNGPYAMGGYEATADSEQPMMFRVCLSSVRTNQWMPLKKSHVDVFDVTWIRNPVLSSVEFVSMFEALKAIDCNHQPEVQLIVNDFEDIE
ncbi:unnamed protein product [Larinioides sclopetarius]|uniref:Uncharacterized protein n=1 Tax=Larinioides sclopetarius TaxID=280406 RepID=A0AAV2ACH5_9ARAC